MSCALTQGLNLDCRDNFGGVKDTWTIEMDNATLTVTAGKITAIANATGKRWYKYKLVSHTGEADDAMTNSRENGTQSSKQSLKFPINKMTTAVRNEILLLAQNRLFWIVQDNNDKYWLFGKDFGLMLASASAKTGKALGDRNGYELVFEGDEKYFAYEVDSTLIAALETAGT